MMVLIENLVMIKWLYLYLGASIKWVSCFNEFSYDDGVFGGILCCNNCYLYFLNIIICSNLINCAFTEVLKTLNLLKKVTNAE